MYDNISNITRQQAQFGAREVGLTHPDLPSYIRLGDNGQIMIMADQNVGIILDPIQKTITLVGDRVKFLTKEDGGLRWNQLAFNPKATKYSEPTFKMLSDQVGGAYDGISDFLED